MSTFHLGQMMKEEEICQYCQFLLGAPRRKFLFILPKDIPSTMLLKNGLPLLNIRLLECHTSQVHSAYPDAFIATLSALPYGETEESHETDWLDQRIKAAKKRLLGQGTRQP